MDGGPIGAVPIAVNRQTVLQGVNLAVVASQAGERALQVMIPSAGEVIVIPMSLEVARVIGSQLMAPGVVLPEQNGGGVRG